MRNAFGKWFSNRTHENCDILISGDIGYGIFDDLINNRPNDFINFGIAEQNMIGVAAGLSKNGFTPWVYTIIPFLVFRPFEFIRNLICYDFANVKLVGVGGGLVYDSLGYTHFAVEDLSALSQLQNLKILTPYSPINTQECAEIARSFLGPTYLRLGKGGELDFVPSSKLSGADYFSKNDASGLIITYGNYANYLLSNYINNDCNFNILVVYDVSKLNITEHFFLSFNNIIFVEEQIGSGFNQIHKFLNANNVKYKLKNLDALSFSDITDLAPSRDALLEFANLDFISLQNCF